MIAKTATGRVAKSKRKEAHQDLPMTLVMQGRFACLRGRSRVNCFTEDYDVADALGL